MQFTAERERFMEDFPSIRGHQRSDRATGWQLSGFFTSTGIAMVIW
jgi:hypothetical protein